MREGRRASAPRRHAGPPAHPRRSAVFSGPRPSGADLLVRARRRLARLANPRSLPRQAVALLWLTALALVISVASVSSPEWVPASSMVVVLLLGGFFLRLRGMLLLFLVAASGLMWTQSRRDYPFQVVPGVVLVMGVIAVLVLLWVRSRERLGLQGIRGDTMLADLRDALADLGTVPPLPAGWHLEIESRAAFGDSFSGDFVVTSRLDLDGSPNLQVALVDVSGKGEQAGSRSLLLSGALGGLLGAVPADEFLAIANRYLLRQDWAEGFATASHLSVDVGTGAFSVGSAGHPPAATGARGRTWHLLDGDHGPALGLLPDVAFPAAAGHLGSGEAMVLYTDGLVETPDLELADGIDTLVALVCAEGVDGFSAGAAARVVDALGASDTDDRTLVLLWRD